MAPLILVLKMLINMKKLRALCCFILISSTLIAETISKKDITESFSETVKVSGTYFLGMQYNSNQKIKKLHISFPKDSAGTLCINIASIDGRYKASINHKLSSKVSDLISMNFPSDYENELEDYESNELAVLAWLDESCNKPNDKILVASWDSTIEDQNVLLLIRSDARKDVVHLSNTSKTFKCKKFRSKYKVTYDKYCELKQVDVLGLNQIQIIRKNLQKIPPVLIKLAH